MIFYEKKLPTLVWENIEMLNLLPLVFTDLVLRVISTKPLENI